MDQASGCSQKLDGDTVCKAYGQTSRAGNFAAKPSDENVCAAVARQIGSTENRVTVEVAGNITVAGDVQGGFITTI